MNWHRRENIIKVLCFAVCFLTLGCLQDSARKVETTSMPSSGVAFMGIENVVSDTDSTATIRWSLTFGAAGYRVYQYNSMGTKNLIGVVPSNQSSFEAENLIPGRTYRFQVNSFDLNDVEDRNTISINRLHYPGLVSAQAFSVDQVQLNFSAVPTGVTQLVLHKECPLDPTLDGRTDIFVGNTAGKVPSRATTFIAAGFKSGIACDLRLEATSAAGVSSLNDNISDNIRPYYVMRDFVSVRAYGKSEHAPPQTPVEPQVWLTWLGLKSSLNAETYIVLRTPRGQAFDFGLLATAEANLAVAFNDSISCVKNASGNCDIKREPATTRRTCRADSPSTCIACFVKQKTESTGVLKLNVYSCKDVFVQPKERYQYVVVPVKQTLVNGILTASQPTDPQSDIYDGNPSRWSGPYRLGVGAYVSDLNNLNMSLKVAVPDQDMILVHRESVNRHSCAQISQRSNVLEAQTCPYTGPGAKPRFLDAAGAYPALNVVSGPVFDFGYHLFVDRYEAGGKYTVTQSPATCGGLDDKKCVITRSSWAEEPISLGVDGVPQNTIIYLADVGKVTGSLPNLDADLNGNYEYFQHHFYICTNTNCSSLHGDSNDTRATPISDVPPKIYTGGTLGSNSLFQNIQNIYTRSPKFLDDDNLPNPTPPLSGVNSEQAQAICDGVTIPGYNGKGRLPRKRDFLALAQPAIPIEGAWEPMAFQTQADFAEVYYASARTNHTYGRGLKESLNTSSGYFTTSRGCNHLFPGNLDLSSAQSTTDEALTADGIKPYIKSAFSSETANNFSASGPDKLGVGKFIIGSEGSRNCVSRYGAQDHVGNMAEWTSDSISYRASEPQLKKGGLVDGVITFVANFLTESVSVPLQTRILSFSDNGDNQNYRLDEEFSNEYYGINSLDSSTGWLMPTMKSHGLNTATSAGNVTSTFPLNATQVYLGCESVLMTPPDNRFVACAHNRAAPMLGLTWFNGTYGAARIFKDLGSAGFEIDTNLEDVQVTNAERTLFQFPSDSTAFLRPDFLDIRVKGLSTPDRRPHNFLPHYTGVGLQNASDFFDVNQYRANLGNISNQINTYGTALENYKHIFSIAMGAPGISTYSGHYYQSNLPKTTWDKGFRCVFAFDDQ